MRPYNDTISLTPVFIGGVSLAGTLPRGYPALFAVALFDKRYELYGCDGCAILSPHLFTYILIVAVVLILSGSGIFYFGFGNVIQRGILLSQSIANPYGSSGTLALNDPLRDNSNGNFWYEGSDSRGSCSFTSGAYHVSANIGGAWHYCTASPEFSNFAFEAQMTIFQGDGGGLVFKVDNLNQSYYYFRVNTNGIYELDIYQNSSFVKQIAQGSLSSVSGHSNINTGVGQQHVLAVVADGGNITLYMDQQKATSVQDSTFNQGRDWCGGR